MKRALFFVIILLRLPVFGQQVIKLDDISKLILTTRGGGPIDEKKILEVVPINKGWECYQTRLRKHDSKGRRIDDSARTFVRNVPPETLQRLLDIIAKRDTGIDRKLFKIDKSALVTFIDSIKIDSIKPDLKPAQRAEFIDSLRSEAIINTTLNDVLHPPLMDDKTYFGITIITKQNTQITIYAESFASLYEFPWHIDNIESFDPNISAIFFSISGIDNYPEFERGQLYDRMVRAIYYKYFRTRFTWDNFKSGQPALFAILGNTFTPVIFYKYHEIWIATCKSSLLPQYVQIRFWFKQNDSSAIIKVKRYEDTLIRIFKNDNFLFDYLKANPGHVLELEQDKMKESGKYLFRGIKKYFEGIDKYDYRQCQFFLIYNGRKTVSKWILLPDNTLVLIKIIINDKQEPLSYKLELSDKYSLPHTIPVCVVFNASGKIIYNYGLAEGVIDY
jgi:hypothetical protein